MVYVLSKKGTAYGVRKLESKGVIVVQMKLAIQGLSEFTRAIKKLDADLPKMVRVANNSAADLLISKARPLIPARTGKARASLKAQSTRASARISVGGPKAPYYPWLDFGGRTGRKRSVVRPFYKAGRYIYPTLSKYQEEIAQLQYDALKDIAKAAGLDVK